MRNHEGKNNPNFKYDIAKEQLYSMYCVETMSKRQIAKKFGCNSSTIARKLRGFGIKSRTMKETQQLVDRGCEKNGSYIDGRSSKQYYCIMPNCNNKIGYWNWLCGTGKCQICSRKGINKGRKRPDVTQRLKGKKCPEISIRMMGRQNHMFGRSCPHTKHGMYKNIWMRSSWEILYAKYLDRNNIEWEYEPKRFDLKNFTYTPDFYLLKLNEYVEIKGWWRAEARQKFSLFKQLYPKIKIKVLMKPELQELGVL